MKLLLAQLFEVLFQSYSGVLFRVQEVSEKRPNRVEENEPLILFIWIIEVPPLPLDNLHLIVAKETHVVNGDIGLGEDSFPIILPSRDRLALIRIKIGHTLDFSLL